MAKKSKKSHAKKACMTGKKLRRGWRFGKGGRCIKAKK